MKKLLLILAIVVISSASIAIRAEPNQRLVESCNGASLDYDARMPMSKSRHLLSQECFISLSLPPKKYSATDTLWRSAELASAAKNEPDITARGALVDSLVSELLLLATTHFSSERLAPLGGKAMIDQLASAREGMNACITQSLTGEKFSGKIEAGLDAVCYVSGDQLVLIFASTNFDFALLTPV
jgi:hypothetical protein